MQSKILALVGAGAICLTSCDPPTTTTEATPTPEPLDPNAIEIVFTYGSEKEDWVNAVTETFNKQKNETSSGRPIVVRPIPMGSGECIDTLMTGAVQAHVTSPASGAFIKLGNAQSQAKSGKDLIGPTSNLVLSPVVIAMWKPMAEALGWGKKPIGWAEILEVVRNPEGWASMGHPEWGPFRFGHTSPTHSNSGLISLFAEVYAATGKTRGLTLADVEKPETAQFLSDIENAVVHYGSSTGFFGKRMFSSGPQFLSAAVLYENMVVSSYDPKYNLPFPIVAIYPREGTFWSDHPAGVVLREWVTPEHEEAAQKYIDFLLADEQQKRALEFGFRPASPDVPVSSPIDLDHGVNPNEPQTILDVPDVAVMDAILRLWQDNKKRSSVMLVFDISGSMRDDDKIRFAREGALELLSAMDDRDDFSLVPFHQEVLSSDAPKPLGPQREKRVQQVSGLFAGGGTALYDAVATAHQTLVGTDLSRRIGAIVVLSDGQDSGSRMKLEQLLSQIKATPERETIRVFTISYGKDADTAVLEEISESTQAKTYKGKPDTIREVFRDISTFF